jgi:hypothetical protein
MTTQAMINYSRLLFTAITLTGWGMQPASAQDKRPDAGDSLSKIKKLLGKVQQAYHHTAYLGFRIKYLYANEGQTDKNTDSLTGEVEMDKGRCRFVIDGTETVLTDKYAIQVMNEDKAIYLSAAHHAGMSNPVSMLDSVFAHIEGIHTDLQAQGPSEVLTLRFPPGGTYSLIRIQVDAHTGYFEKITYSLYTVGLVGQDLIEKPGRPGPYQSKGQVNIIFSHYEQGRFDDTLFKEGNFFTKTAGRFEPASQYKDYHIFLASSNL